MTVRVSAAVMAHPAREAMVTDLVSRLDRPVPVVWDQCSDRHDTGIRAIEAYDPTATHHLVIQDDTVPCRDLLASVERALAWVPDGHSASFYLGAVSPFRKPVQRAVDHAGTGSSWVVMDGIYWGPAAVIPTACIPGISEWWRTSSVTNYDRRLSAWFQERGLRCWYSWPSLVDHRGDKSLVRGGKATRRAHRFHGTDQSGLDVDWSGPVADLRGTARLDQRRQAAAAGGG